MGVYIRKRKLKNGTVRVYLDMYHNGVRQYEFPENLCYVLETKKETLDLAKRLAARRQLELAHAETGFSPGHRRRANFLDFFKDLGNHKTENRTRISWNTVLGKLESYGGNRVPFSVITSKWLEEFRDFLLDSVSQNTTNLYLTKIKAALKEAVKQNYLDKNPADSFAIPKNLESPKVYLNLEEIQKLANTECVYPEIRRAFLFSCFSGLRLSDVENLTWEQIHRDKEEVRLHFRQIKTKGYEYITLNESAIQLLNPEKPSKLLSFPQAPIFNLPKRSTIHQNLSKWVKASGIEKPITFHCGRHTYATMSLSSGASISTVQRLLGHRDMKSTAVYAKVTDIVMKEAVAKFPKISLAT